MKKILFMFIMLFSLGSCVPLKTTTTLIGDVTAYNNDGTILRKWDNVIIEEETKESYSTSSSHTTNNETSLKSFGLNFYDKNLDKFIIITKAVPCIIEYNINTSSKVDKPYNDNIPSKDYLKNTWKELDNEYNNIKKQMKTLDKNSNEYKTLNEKKIGVQKRKTEIENMMFKFYNGFIN